jgi:formylmethanofuran dehydrogenase subunit A
MAHRKGSLAVGADGDVTIYDIDPTRLDVTANYNDLLTKFRYADYTVKGGEIVAHNGEIMSIPERRTYYSDIKVDANEEKKMLEDVKDWFRYYTLGFENYPTPEKYLVNPTPINVNMEK